MTGRLEPIPATPKVQCALALARQYPDELMHAEQVARLSAMLFQALQAIHNMGPREGELLYCAALLHDIGISVSYSGHHKHSLRLIERSRLPAFTRGERDVLANLARYHRKAKPKPKHNAFAQLAEHDQTLVRRLAAILRVADGLDRAHENAVMRIEARAETATLWQVDIYGHGDLAYAAWGANRKAGLFHEVYGVGLRVEPKGPPPPAPTVSPRTNWGLTIL